MDLDELRAAVTRGSARRGAPALRAVLDRHTRTPAQQAGDRRRDQRHTAAGFTPLRFTHAQITYEPHEVKATLGAVAKRLSEAPYPS